MFLWTRKMKFWRFCSKVSPKFGKFWLRMHFWRLLNYFRREFNNFEWKTKLNWKTNMFLIKTPQKVLGTLKMQFQRKWRNFFSKLIFFSPESEVKKNMRTIHKKNKKVARTRRMHICKHCWTFSPEVWTIIDQSPKTILKKSQKKITFLKVLLWTRKL